ncbi:Aldehyde dehydrogenase [Hypsizygus marmoreus]|uniref:Aldehyde dehydrogenase n=1 Tax=Hypsizygus marmoreus TaxID=39966 RepID=A0A369J1P5_HYPMA|nr:Aldehyde dehydrogenase [Hypsizygus marmoreus]
MATVNAGLFINGECVDPVKKATVDVVNTATGKVITSFAAGASKDVDIAVDAARKSFKASWGLNYHGVTWGKLIKKAKDLIEQHFDEFAALEALDTNDKKLAYTRRGPFGIVGQIILENFPLLMAAAKIGPALPPRHWQRRCFEVDEAGFPPGVVNIVNGYGNNVMKAVAESNLKVVTLELGGKTPTIIFDDANLEQAVKWAAHGILSDFRTGQACTAGSRIFIQDGIYSAFLEKITEIAKGLHATTGDPFAQGTEHGPQVSQTQFDRVMGYIHSGKEEGATVHFVASVMRFKAEDDVIEAANNTTYGLACNVFSENLGRALRVAHSIEAGTAWLCGQLSTLSSLPDEQVFLR